MKISFIPPIAKSDYLANTVIDGLLWLKKDGEETDLRIPNYNYPCPYDISEYQLNETDFIGFSKESDLIILSWGKGATNYDLANRIDRWDKTVFIDGSELGKNRRSDPSIRKQVEDMTYEGGGAIDKEMLKKASLYFRREKPYIHGIIPLPFGIESRYIAHYDRSIKKDIDFTCIFGQEDYPILRKEVRQYLEKFCKENDFVCATKKTKGFSFDDDKKLAGRNEFYDILARSKVGISVGGGGFDTARFWEILGNNCILLTEKIHISISDIDNKRLFEFKDLAEFKDRLEKVASYLKNEYKQEDFDEDYGKISDEHSTKARVRTILQEAHKKGI